MFLHFFFHFFKIFISWRLITLQYCSDFCHALTWISHGYTCVPHPDPPSHLPLPGNDTPICKTEKETQMYRTDFWTLWEKVRVGCFERTASKHVYYQGWNRSAAQVGCMRQVLGAGAVCLVIFIMRGVFTHYLGCLICWHTIIYPCYFCKACSNVLTFISNFSYLSPCCSD